MFVFLFECCVQIKKAYDFEWIYHAIEFDICFERSKGEWESKLISCFYTFYRRIIGSNNQLMVVIYH